MRTLELPGTIDEHHSLRAEVPGDLRPGEVRMIALLLDRSAVPDKTPADGEDETGELFRAGLAHEWAEELSDPLQDIYSITDGLPVDASR